MAADFTEASGIEVKPNVVDNETFQESINSYLQGNADDVFTWFAGFRTRFFDDQASSATSPTCGRWRGSPTASRRPRPATTTSRSSSR